MANLDSDLGPSRVRVNAAATASARRGDAIRLVTGLGGVAAITLIYAKWLHVSNAATVSTTFLTVVLLVAAISRLRIAVVTSVAAMLCLNFFFLPPVGTFTIADPQNWVALFAFLAVSLVASHLSSVARARTDEALARRDEVARLFDLSRDVLVMTDSREGIGILARSIARRFDLAFVAVALPRLADWDIFEAGDSVQMDKAQLAKAFAVAQTSLEFDASARTYAGHATMSVDSRTIRLVPLRVGTKPIGLLAAEGGPIDPGTLDTLGGLVAIAVERTQFLEERKRAELTSQSEALKTALLASLGHDLRTPLTAIRVAASNLKSSWLTPDDRREQSEVVLAEVERLTRLFQNVLEMARIDARAVAAESRWTHPSEILAAARDQVEHTLGSHPLEVTVEQDIPLRLDPRLTSTALAHLLENAAQYAPEDSAIHVSAQVTPEGLVIRVRDHGPGIAPADLPHLFERFYRGIAARRRTSGTGMGLWIARGLLAAQQGRVWAENCPDGGAQFTIDIPAASKVAEQAIAPPA
jgi:two-component system, OmpR family, sensor histidine kinase KdpD